MCRTLSSFRDTTFLAASLAELVRPVLDFERICLQLYDSESNRIVFLPQDAGQTVDEPAWAFRFEDWPLSWVWAHQRVLSGEIAECRARYGYLAKLPYYQRDGGYTMLPLTSSRRSLGGLEILRRECQEASAEDQYVMQTLAFALSEALEAIVSTAIANRAYQQLAKEREHDRILVEVTNAVITNLDLRKLIVEVSNSLRTYFGVEFVSMELRVRNAAVEGSAAPAESFEAHLLCYPGTERDVEVRDVKAVEEAPMALVIERKAAFLAGQEDLRRMASSSQFAAFLHSQGVLALCALPLISGDHVFGVLSLARLQRADFSEDEAKLLQAVADRVAIAVNNAIAYQQISRLKDKLTSEKLYLQEQIGENSDFGAIIGQSVALRRVLDQVQMVADSDSTVLIMGETGTGKELIARAIHNLSKRKAHTMVKVNCAAIPAGLFESDLFGHERGAFTGAVAPKPGRFEFANRSTLFLDEIGEVPMEVQPKLLRALQEHEIDRLGSQRVTPVDVRVIAATNCNLPLLVRENRFRSDLYYRLSVFPIVIPPLRERQEDIPLLVRYFTQKYSERMNRGIESITTDTMQALCHLPWPGNVRELENAIERAVILSRGPVLHIPSPEALFSPGLGAGEMERAAPAQAVVVPAYPTTAAPLAPPVRATAMRPLGAHRREEDRVTREQILKALEDANGLVGGPRGAAAQLGLKRTTLLSRMKKLGISTKLSGEQETEQ
ncbi:MAG: sigma 54-interacting transcriptional regulator [Acidobacteriota bacterium]|nr:sigma 54-interacting transcriptional regulator [Acidobacteriota bacterium]